MFCNLMEMFFDPLPGWRKQAWTECSKNVFRLCYSFYPLTEFSNKFPLEVTDSVPVWIRQKKIHKYFSVCREWINQKGFTEVSTVLLRVQCCLQDVGTHIATPVGSSNDAKKGYWWHMLAVSSWFFCGCCEPVDVVDNGDFSCEAQTYFSNMNWASRNCEIWRIFVWFRQHSNWCIWWTRAAYSNVYPAGNLFV